MKIKINLNYLHEQIALCDTYATFSIRSHNKSTSYMFDGIANLLSEILSAAENGDWVEFEVDTEII